MTERRAAWLAICSVGSLVLIGCGKGEDLKGYSEPLEAVNRAELWIGRLQGAMAQPDYTPVREMFLGRVQSIVEMELPYSLEHKLKDASVKQQIQPHIEQLQKVFKEQVHEPVFADPLDLDKARAGVDECLGVVQQIKQILGG